MPPESHGRHGPGILAGTPTADPTARPVGVEGRRCFAAEWDRVGAARVEAAADGHRGRRRDGAGDGLTTARASRRNAGTTDSSSRVYG